MIENARKITPRLHKPDARLGRATEKKETSKCELFTCSIYKKLFENRIDVHLYSCVSYLRKVSRMTSEICRMLPKKLRLEVCKKEV